jgi:hypothetical protein
MLSRSVIALASLALALTSCTDPAALAQVRPSPQFVRWLTLRPAPGAFVAYAMTAPLESNFGTCEAPEYRSDAAPMTIRWRWTGPASGEAFVMAAPGDTVRIEIPASAESLHVLTERFGHSCGDTSVAVLP